MSSSNSSLLEQINNVKRNAAIFSQVYSLILIVFGIVGHAFNIYIFTRPKFRRNSCVRYFLASTFSGDAVVLFTIPARMLQIGFGVDLFAYSVTTCKILSYIFPCFRILPSWFIGLASIDRFLCSSSSAKLRRWSNLRVANYVILFTVLFVLLSYTHLLFYQTIASSSRTCALVSSTYQTFYALWLLIFWSWMPTTCMLIFGLLIIRNIRQGKRRVAVQNYYQRNQSKTNRQLIHMLLFQSFVMGSTTTAISIGTLYISITSSFMIKNDLDKAKDTYLSGSLNYVASTGACMSFYVFTLSSQLFRNELIKLFSYWKIPTRVTTNVTATRT